MELGEELVIFALFLKVQLRGVVGGHDPKPLRFRDAVRQLGGATKLLDVAIILVQILITGAQVFVRHGKVGIELQRLAEHQDRLGRIAIVEALFPEGEIPHRIQ